MRMTLPVVKQPATIMSKSKMASPQMLADIERHVDQLQKLIVSDDQPAIEARSGSIAYTINFDTNFVDSPAFHFVVSKYIQEATIQSHLNDLLLRGNEFATLLYTWRSCSRAIPLVQRNDQADRNEIHRNTIRVLDPEMKKLIDFMKFQKQAVDFFKDEIRKLANSERIKEFVSESYLLTLAKVINMFADLDALKNGKASVKNDFALYKRACTIIKHAIIEGGGIKDAQDFSLFLASQDAITTGLKKQLEEINGFEDVLAEVINLCINFYENKKYMTPKGKFMLLRVMGYSLYLIDGNKANIHKWDPKKKIPLNLNKIDRFFVQRPVIPVSGDMAISLSSYIRKCPHYDPTKWSCTMESVEDKARYQFDLSVREIHYDSKQLLLELSQVKKASEGAKKMDRASAIEHHRQLFRHASRGLTLISTWTTYIFEQYSYKLLHPTSSTINGSCPKDAEEYERATRYNYSPEEKLVLIELIAAIKSIEKRLNELEPILMESIRRVIHMDIQTLVQQQLRPIIRVAVKKKKTVLKDVLICIRRTCADWLQGSEPDDPALRGEKDPKNYTVEVPLRSCGPSSTQLYLVRTFLESIISEKGGMSRKPMRKDLDPGTISLIEEFLNRSFSYNHLLNYGEVMRECCDLSQLWYREFFLEMTMGKRIQFPIEMSMPWILISYILESKEPSLVEFILYPLDLYNDSANFALYRFRRQHLFDEIEAEVNLCFDQLVYNISDHIYSYYKTVAGSMILDKRFRSEAPSASQLRPAPSNRYKSILQQKHVQLLGRNIDMNRLITQRINSAVQKSLDIAINRFESKAICGIIELETLINVNKQAHKMMSEFLSLTSFDLMLQEADHSISSPYGRITLHAYSELYYDVIPNYCYNSTTNRFVRTKFTFVDEVEREPASRCQHHQLFGTKALNAAYSAIFSLYDGYIGMPHFASIVRLVRHRGITEVISDLLKLVVNSLHSATMEYCRVLMNGLPKKCHLPRFDYGSAGVLDYYHAQLKDILQYRELKMDVFQQFREIGNSVVFCMMIDQALKKVQSIRERNIPFFVDSLMKQLGSKSQLKSVKDSLSFLSEQIRSSKVSLTEAFLVEMKNNLDDQIWVGPPPENGVIHIEECNQFHRVWSAIQFVICLPLRENELTVEETFGDGLTWAGCTLIALLEQSNRFRALDFCYHISRVHQIDRKDADVAGVPLRRLVERINAFWKLNDQVFTVISRYCKTSESEVRTFDPPTVDQDDW
ncbi:Cytoplasmic FMR1-interacting protein 2 [Trichoplax sp. H2]|nr:Cytoplasmic FMR1-interacting protein 2 [Trichoplax sp. H2]|eukprot:RDD41868.1 Cytoplasmic FMR1-interacting protein 2 [Trichoplax sp. H2]